MGVSATGGGGGAGEAAGGRVARLDATQACRMTGERGQAVGVLFFGRSKKVVGPSLAITSRRNTNITFFPFASGQRGGNRARARRTRCVWKGGRKSTQTMLQASSFCANKIFARRWSL